MSVEAPAISQVKNLSAKEKIKRVNLESLSIAEAGELATNYFREEYDIFEQRFVALRDKVPQNIAETWDQQAINYAVIADSLTAGDARPLKHFVITSGMEINRQSLNEQNNDSYRTFGNSLYGVGARMSSMAVVEN
jgi:hypothetical protein